MVTDFEYVVSTSLFTDDYARQMSARVLGSSPESQNQAAFLRHFSVPLYTLMGSQ